MNKLLIGLVVIAVAEIAVFASAPAMNLTLNIPRNSDIAQAEVPGPVLKVSKVQPASDVFQSENIKLQGTENIPADQPILQPATDKEALWKGGIINL